VWFCRSVCRHGQIALPYRYSDNPLMAFCCWVHYLHFSPKQHIETR